MDPVLFFMIDRAIVAGPRASQVQIQVQIISAQGVPIMRPLSLLCFALCLALSASEAFARGGMGSHMSMGGALGTSAATPGTNSLGTALPSSGTGGHVMNGPLLGTDATIDKEDARVEKMLEGSICRGC